MRLRFDAVNGFQTFVLLRFSFAILLSIAMVKSGTSLAIIGQYEALMLLGSLFTFFWMTGLLNGLLSYFPKLDPTTRPAFLTEVAALVTLLSAGMAVLLWLGRGWVVPTLTSFEALPHYHWMCLWVALNLPTYLLEHLYILQDRPRKMVSFGLYSFGGQFLAVVLPLLLGYGLAVSFQWLVALAVTKQIWLWVELYPVASRRLRWQHLRPYLAVASPLVIYTLVGGMMNSLDGVIIMRHLDETAFVIYRNGARELPLSLALLNAMSAALVPQVATDLRASLATIRQRTGRLIAPLFGLSIALMFLAQWAFPLVFSSDFTGSALIFKVYLLILVSRIILPQTLLIGLQHTRIILWASVLETGLNLTLSLWWISYWGLAGVALATVVAFLTEKLFLIIYLQRRLAIAPSAYIRLWPWLGWSAALLAAFALSEWG